jgi:DNA (cytosine-5)-methyltransferase 1
MTHASLFIGIGGFDYAAALLVWINIFDCEIDAFCRKVLEYHFPNSYADKRSI